LATIEDKLLKHEPECPVTPNLTSYSPEMFQLEFSTTRLAGPELLFQPSICGLEQSGLGETLRHVLNRLTAKEQNRVLENVFVCGGNTLYPNFVERLTNELIAIRPYQSNLNVRAAGDSRHDAWKGACALANTAGFLSEMCITREHYLEMGPGYLAEHAW
jgi:actin-related protein 5